MTRTVLVVICLALVALALLGMRRGWRRRLAGQSGLAALPETPGDLGAAVLRMTGLYVGSTFAGQWQNRVVHDSLGRRASGTATLYDAGVLVERDGERAIFVPTEDLLGARLAPGLAGKVVGDGGLFVVRWRLGDAELDTGFRADDKGAYPDWVTAVNAKVSA